MPAVANLRLCAYPCRFIVPSPRHTPAWASFGLSLLLHGAVLALVLPQMPSAVVDVSPRGVLEVRLAQPQVSQPVTVRQEYALAPATPIPTVVRIRPPAAGTLRAIEDAAAEPSPSPPTHAARTGMVVPTGVESGPPAAPPVTEAPVTPPDTRAAYLANPRPPYPVAARRMGWEGKVLLRVEVLADGTCGTVAVAVGSGYRLLDEAAAEAVKRWRFVPARRGAEPVAAWVEIPVVFRLTGSSADPDG